MYRILLFYFLNFSTFFCLQAKGDTIKHQSFLFAGIGNYEYVHAGIYVPIKKKHYFEMGAGIKPWGFKNSNYQMAYLTLGRRLLREKERKLKPYLHLKVLTWHFNNRYNQFVVLGINPELRLTYHLNDRVMLVMNAGVLYNSPFYYERKTYLEVGWPKEWQPSFSLQYLVRIK